MTDDNSIVRANPILAKYRATLAEMHGDRLERVVLFGSRARGDARPDSDYDLAIFLNGMNGAAERWAELHELADLRVKFIDETGAFFDAKPYPPGAYRDVSPLMHQIRAEGLDCDAASRALFAQRRGPS
jgi:uncharacterized protein